MVSTRALASILGVTDRHVRDLAQKEVLPRAGRGKYPLVAAVRAYCGHVRTLRASAQATDAEDALRVRKLEAQTREAEIDLAVREGNLVTLKDHVDTVAEVLTLTRNRMLNMPGWLAPQVVGLDSVREAMRVLKPAVDQCMIDICEKLKELGEREAD